MNLYLLSQNKNNGYDTYDACIVCAIDENDAKTIHPAGRETPIIETDIYSSWVGISDVECEFIGTAHNQKRGVILSSFNAG